MSTTDKVKASYFYPDGETKGSDDSAKNIDSSLFTHLYCAFANVDAKTHHVFVSEKHDKIFSDFTQTVQIRNPDVKTLLSIGGRKADRSAFASMARNSTTRKYFIDSSISIARSKGFDGLDLAWEYPNGDREMTNFKNLLEEWHLAIEDEHRCNGNPLLLLTATVYYSPVYYSVSYPVEVMKQSLDWVNIIAYDFYNSSTIIGPPAALYDPENPKAPCGHSGLKQWINAGLPEKKAVFGFPYVGWKWIVEDSDDPTTTIRVATTADNSINYDQIRSFIVDEKAKTFYDAMVVGDKCLKDTTLIGYDDIATVVTKVRNAKLSGWLGYFSWNVGADDNSALSLAASAAWDVAWDA